MYGNKIRYLASVFVDADSITPTAEHISGLLKALNDDRFIPVNVQERSKPRIAFATDDGEWQLILQGNRFNLSRHSTELEGGNLGEFSDFCKDAISKLKVPLEYFKRKGQRLATVQEGMLPELSVDKMNELATRLFKLPRTYSENRSFEWDWRTATRIERSFGKLNEVTNTVTTIKRLAGTVIIPSKGGGQKETQQIERIRVDFDINTLHSNVIARFDESNIADFFEQSASWHQKLSSEIFSFILKGD